MAWDVKVRVYIFLKRLGDRIGLDLPYFMKNGFWITFRQGMSALSGLLLAAVFARLAAQEIFGQYQFILSTLAIVSVFSVPGLNTSVIRSAANGYDGDYRKAVKISFLWSLLGIPALLIIGGYYFVYQDTVVGLALMISSIFFPFFYAPNTWDSFLQGKSRFDISAKFSSIQALINTVGTIGVIFFYRDNLIAVIVFYLASYSSFNVYYFIRSLRYVGNAEKDADMARYGWFLTKINILGMLSGNLDKILVGMFLGPAQLAVYSVGILFAKQIQNVSKSFLWISVPKQIQQGAISKGNYAKMFFLSLLATAIFLFSFQFIVPFLFTDKYVESVSLSMLSILFYPAFIMSVLYRNQMIFSKKEKILFRESLISPLAMVSLMTAILPLFGIHGLAFLFGFQHFIGLFVLYALDKMTNRSFFAQKQ